MAEHSVQGVAAARGWKRVRKFVSGGAAAALVAGTLVFAGIGVQSAMAAPAKPEVSASAGQSLVLGEDLTVSVTIENDTNVPSYNLSVSVLLTDTVDVVAPAPFGPVKTYLAGETLPGKPVNGDTCATLGLTPGQPAGACKVPAGMQYLVFENFSDLPANATLAESLKLRPKVNQATGAEAKNGFNVGDTVTVKVNAYTNSDERFIPVFPGSTSVATADAVAGTSSRGSDAADTKVRALRITKSEPSPESELLRGVHNQTTVYTLVVDHTGEGDLSDAEIVDFLPAGLEYLGSCSLDDNTRNANGTGGLKDEWTGAGALDTSDVEYCKAEAAIETVEMDTATAAKYLNADGNQYLTVGAVYTKVTWNMGSWLKGTGNEQIFPETPGVPASTTIQYRAGIPLFENTMNFVDETPAAASLKQGANLDNNSGASTRHGTPDSTDSQGKSADSLRNVATASGSWTGKHGDLTAVSSEDHNAESVEVVDVRILKDVRIGKFDDIDDGWSGQASFEQGRIADYRLQVATSEYVSATLGERPNRLVDDLANGLCPVYPEDVSITDDADAPNFRLEDPNSGGTPTYVSETDFNEALAAAGFGKCQWGTTDDDATFSGATLTGIAFNPKNGHFYQDLAFDPADVLAAPNRNATIVYSAFQNSSYLDVGGVEDGATSSGDAVPNTVELEMTTTMREGAQDIENSEGISVGEEFWAWDNSSASVLADTSSISKTVLRNDPGLGVPGGQNIWKLDYADPAAPGSAPTPNAWTKKEDAPFALGDEVWFKLHFDAAGGADVRNPVIADFLPEGLTFDKAQLHGTDQWRESPNFRAFASKNGAAMPLVSGGTDFVTPVELGVCSFKSPTGLYSQIVSGINFDGDDRKLTWNLGSSSCFPNGDPSASSDRFWPKGIDLDLYIRATVSSTEAFGAVDISQNLAKYQQNNVEGKIFFQRDQAEVVAATTPRLMKGIESINNAPAAGNSFNTDVDHLEVVQKQEVRFRVDVTSPVRGVNPATGTPAPNTQTTDYVVWDALPEGVHKADIKGVKADGTFDSAAVSLEARAETGTGTGAWVPETPVSTDKFTAKVVDFGEDGYPVKPDVRADIWDAERSLIIWTVGADVLASSSKTTLEDEPVPPATQQTVLPRTERGFSLHYTVVVPDGTTSSEAALLGQTYENIASIVSYETRNNTKPTDTSTIVPEPSAGQPATEGPLSRQPAAATEFGTSGEGTLDDSDVYLPRADGDKKLVSTEVGPNTGSGRDSAVGQNHLGTNNNGEQIVQGEYANFKYSASVPANTSILSAVLADDEVLRYGTNSSVTYEVKAPATLTTPVDFTGTVVDVTADRAAEDDTFFFNTKTGKLIFPTNYQNSTSEVQTFTVGLSVWVKDRDKNNPAPVIDLPDNTTLTNTAKFSWVNPHNLAQRITEPSTASANYREPKPTISKSVSKATDVVAGQTLTYTLKANNDIARPTSFDSVVIDCVPNGLTAVTIAPTNPVANPSQGSATVAGTCEVQAGKIVSGQGTGTLITWSVGDINANAEKTLKYTAMVSPDAAGAAAYRNYAEISGFTLPNQINGADTTDRRGIREASVDRNITLQKAAITKSVDKATAPVGDTLKYTIVTTLPKNLNFYNVSLSDTLPVGVTYVPGSAVVTPSGSGLPVITNQPVVSNAGRTLTWLAAGDSIDILSNSADRSITITLSAKITPNIGGTTSPLRNTANFAWDSQESNGTRTPLSATAATGIVDPRLTILKDVKFGGEDNWRQEAEGNSDRTLNYQIIVTNTGAATAFQNVIVDTVPDGVVNLRNFKINGADVALPNTAVVSGKTVTWTIPGGIEVGGGNARTLSYTADFDIASELANIANPDPEDAAKVGVGEWQKNVAKVTHFESWDRAGSSTSTGREYSPTGVQADADARALFPYVVPTKTVSVPAGTNAQGDDYGIANVGERFGWTLTLVNTGAGGVQTLTPTDLLPANWEYVANSAQVRIGALAPQQLEPTVNPATGSLDKDDTQTLVWVLGDADSATTLLPGTSTASALASRTITITFDAIPNEHALGNAGTGIVDPADPKHPHTNTLSVVNTDARNDTGNKSGIFTGPNDTADAHIAEADLLLDKLAIGGVISQADEGDADLPADNLHGLAEGTWAAGQGAVAGKYAQPQWQITVNNHGLDDSYGPFVFTDTVTAPAGVLTGQWTATYYPTKADAEAGTNSVSLGNFSGATFTIGTETTKLDKSGDARIILTADVTVPANITTASAAELKNVATVDGRTYEKPANKGDDAEFPNTDEANKALTTLADLTINKTVNTASPNVGSPITWGITVTNLGPSVSKSPASSRITVTDTVPVGMTNVTVTQNADWVPVITRGGTVVSGAAEAGDLVTWTYQKAEMPVGTTAEVTMSGNIIGSHTGQMSNTATVFPTVTPEPNPNVTNEDTEVVTPGTDTMLGIVKTRVVNVDGAWVDAVDMDPVPPYVAGEQISYRIDVTTTGRADARAVTVVDEVPAGLSYASHVGIAGSTWGHSSSGTNAAGVTDANWDTFSLTNPATLAVAATRSFVVTYDTESTVTGAVINWAEASGENSTNDPRDSDNSDSTRKADLGIVKSHTSPATNVAAVAGESVDYQLIVTNHGPSESSAPITVTDVLPAGFSYQAGSASVSVNSAAATTVDPVETGQSLTWTALTEDADLPLNATIVITFTADIAPSVRAQTGLENVASVTAPEDSNPNNNVSRDPVNIVTDTVMEITKTVEDGPWVAGTQVEYELTIQNNGSSAAPASVVDTLPTGLTMVSMTGSSWDCSAVVVGAQTGACAYTATNGLHPVGSGSATTITVIANIAANAASLEQPLKNSAVLTWTDTEGSKTDSDDADITVTRVADLGIEKSALAQVTDEEGLVSYEPTTTATAGTSLWYRLVVANGGPSDAIAPLVINDTLPAGMTFVMLTGASASSWSAVVDTTDPQLVTFTRTAAGILNGQTAPEILFEVAIDATVPVLNQALEPNVLTNTAEIDKDATLDPNGDPETGAELPDSDTADVVIKRQIDLGIEKSHDADQVRIGDALPFTIDVTNHGPSEASGIVVTDTIPAGLEVLNQPGDVLLDSGGAETGWEILSVTLTEPGDATVDPVIPANPAGGATVVASYVHPVAPGAAAAPLVIDTLVTAAAYETVTNVADVEANEPEPDPDTENPNRAEDPVIVPPMVTLVVEKSAVGEFKVGKTGTYSITVQNLGPTEDPGPITVTDQLPAGLSFSSAPDLPAGATASHDKGLITWTLTEPLAMGEQVQLTLKVNVLQSAYDQPNHEITNTVNVDSESELTPDSVLTDDATVKVKPADPLVVTGGELAGGMLAAFALLLLLGGGTYIAGRKRQRARHG